MDEKRALEMRGARGGNRERQSVRSAARTGRDDFSRPPTLTRGQAAMFYVFMVLFMAAIFIGYFLGSPV